MTELELFIEAFRAELRKLGDIFHTEYVDNAITAAHKVVTGPVKVTPAPIEPSVIMPIIEHVDEGEQGED